MTLFLESNIMKEILYVPNHCKLLYIFEDRESIILVGLWDFTSNLLVVAVL
jgi:hypothetical protein